MVMCSRCHKRVAVVFVTRIENGEKRTEGICLTCARELGMPVDDMLGGVLGKMGLSREEFEQMEGDMGNMLAAMQTGAENGEDPAEDERGDEHEDGGAPAIDFPKLFREAGIFGPIVAADGGNEGGGGGAGKPADQQPNKEAQEPPKQPKNKKEKEKKYKYLDTYCRNLTRAAAEGKLDRIVGRERELSRVIQILCRRQKNNPCLIGEPGVGKTAIAEALAQRIAFGDVPFRLRGCQVYLVDLTALVAGTQFRGQFESRILGLLGEVKSAGNIILVIDEVHNIVGAGDAEGSMNAANMLKPALSRGEVQIIGATTLAEYRKHIEKDSALERRFQPVMVNEPSVEESVEMLGGIKHYYEEFHGIRLPEPVLRRAVVLSERYITDRYLPDKAIDLIDEAAAHLSITSPVLGETRDLREQLLTLKAEREGLEAAGEENTAPQEDTTSRYERLANLRTEELRLAEQLGKVEAEAAQVSLGEGDLADVIEIWTGIPAANITENEFARIDGLAERLRTHIVGQDAAVDAVCRAVKRNRAGIAYKRKPVSFIFAGPTGVGKTELVKTLAADLFDSPETLIRLDMSEFMEKHSVSRIIGAPPGYVGYDEAGQLTEKIRRRPYSVVLFDEIEKAHPDVLNILLQILDDGRVTDAHGKTVNFENTVIVMTTNAGSDRSSASAGFGTADAAGTASAQTERALSTFLRPEFLNRVDEIITFRSLDEHDFARIAAIQLGELAAALAEKHIALTWDDAALAVIARRAFSRKYGARNMRRFIQTQIEDKLAEAIIADHSRSISAARIGTNEAGELVVHCM